MAGARRWHLKLRLRGAGCCGGPTRDSKFHSHPFRFSRVGLTYCESFRFATTKQIQYSNTNFPPTPPLQIPLSSSSPLGPPKVASRIHPSIHLLLSGNGPPHPSNRGERPFLDLDSPGRPFLLCFERLLRQAVQKAAEVQEAGAPRRHHPPLPQPAFSPDRRRLPSCAAAPSDRRCKPSGKKSSECPGRKGFRRVSPQGIPVVAPARDPPFL